MTHVCISMYDCGPVEFAYFFASAIVNIELLPTRCSIYVLRTCPLYLYQMFPPLYDCVYGVYIH
jgi:hypothetical protein